MGEVMQSPIDLKDWLYSGQFIVNVKILELAVQFL